MGLRLGQVGPPSVSFHAEGLCEFVLRGGGALTMSCQGETLEQVMSSMKAVAEGVLTSRSANALAEKLGVDCPIINGIYRVIHGEWRAVLPHTHTHTHMKHLDTCSLGTD